MSGNCHVKHPEIVRVSGKCPENCNIPDVTFQKMSGKCLGGFRPSVQKVSGILQYSGRFPDTQTFSGCFQLQFPDIFFLQGCNYCVEKFNNRFEEFNDPIYQLAFFLHPAYKGAGLKFGTFPVIANYAGELWRKMGKSKKSCENLITQLRLYKEQEHIVNGVILANVKD